MQNLGPIWKILCLLKMGVDVPITAIQYILQQQQQFVKARELRSKPWFYHAKYAVALHVFYIPGSIELCFFLFRAQAKVAVVQRHEREREYMQSLRAVGHNTGEYVGRGRGDHEKQQENDESATEYEDTEDTAETTTCSSDMLDADVSTEEYTTEKQPLLFFYDSEATGGSVYDDHIIEVAAKVIGVPPSINIRSHHYTSLCGTSLRIRKQGV